MSLSSDLKTYADRAASQSKQALGQAQAQLTDVTGQAGELYGKARTNVAGIADKAAAAANDLRASAEKAVNLDAIRSAVEPYLSQVRGYTTTVGDRAESLLAEARKDKRVASLVEAVDQLMGQVEQRLVGPVRSLTGLGGKPSAGPVVKPAPTAKTSKPAAEPTSKPTAASKPAAKSTARKPAAKKTTGSKSTGSNGAGA